MPSALKTCAFLHPLSHSRLLPLLVKKGKGFKDQRSFLYFCYSVNFLVIAFSFCWDLLEISIKLASDLLELQRLWVNECKHSDRQLSVELLSKVQMTSGPAGTELPRSRSQSSATTWECFRVDGVNLPKLIKYADSVTHRSRVNSLVYRLSSKR